MLPDRRLATDRPATAQISTYDFLMDQLIDPDTLARATALAATWDAPVHHILVSVGWVDETDYVEALASSLGAETAAGRCLVPADGVAASNATAVLVFTATTFSTSCQRRRAPTATLGETPHPVVGPRLRGENVTGGSHWLYRNTSRDVRSDGIAFSDGERTGVAIDAYAYEPDDIASVVARARAEGQWMLLATRADFARLRHSRQDETRLADAICGFGRIDPLFSAAAPMPRWQKLMLPTFIAGVVGGLLFPNVALPAFLLALTIPFLCVAVIRLAGLAELLRGTPRNAHQTHEPPGEDETLPVYSILVPLYDEADVLPRLMRSLSALDYPAAQLDILLILEATDAVTQSAAAAIDMPGNVRVIVVPEGGPRTKPKALNYALGFALGSYVVVYDAEDRPEPRQLRDALARFATASADVVCLQARLNTYNPDAGFLTRQFTLEYSVLFDAILPALERLGLPLPLGGTSNHFKTEALRSAGAWDPFNVTEDADLGIRLARLGLRTATIASTTWEEAPADPGNWRRQRTRWLKGWMQTYLVHMRQPRRLLSELGPVPFAGLQILMGGILISVLAHPLIYLLVLHGAWSGRFLTWPETTLERLLWGLAIVNFGIGLMSSIGVGMLAVVRRGRANLAAHALLMPAYWLLISAAGYRAVVQLVRQPYLWEKTTHGRSQRTGTAMGKAGDRRGLWPGRDR